jgi:hypothetical protein
VPLVYIGVIVTVVGDVIVTRYARIEAVATVPATVTPAPPVNVNAAAVLTIVRVQVVLNRFGTPGGGLTPAANEPRPCLYAVATAF